MAPNQRRGPLSGYSHFSPSHNKPGGRYVLFSRCGSRNVGSHLYARARGLGFFSIRAPAEAGRRLGLISALVFAPSRRESELRKHARSCLNAKTIVNSVVRNEVWSLIWLAWNLFVDAHSGAEDGTSNSKFAKRWNGIKYYAWWITSEFAGREKLLWQMIRHFR